MTHRTRSGRGAACLALSGLFAASAVAQTSPLPFPRLGGMLIGSPHNYHQPSYQAQIARLDVAVLGMYNGWSGGGSTPAQVVTQIKALNPAILLANYTIMTEVPQNYGDVATAYKRTKLDSGLGPGGVGNWWAYDANGQHTDWSGGAFGSWDANLTLWTTLDAAGDRWPQWLAQSDHQRLLQGAGFDIWYSDNNMWRPRSDADWDRNGTNDSRDDINVRNWWRSGQRAYYDKAKSIAPSLWLMVNADSDLDGTVFPTNADHFSHYENVAHSAFIEHAMGKSWSVESWGGWALMMSWYRHLETNLLAPRMIVFDVFLPSTSDYQSLRYGFASCLMGDGYFSASTNYNQIAWFDEFDLAGTGTTKWLGQPVDPPPSGPWQLGVYRRQFQNGMALVNPKNNGSRTVTVPDGYRRFQGNQVPAVNDGQPVSTVTLADRDGLLLVKVHLSHVPRPNGPPPR